MMEMLECNRGLQRFAICAGSWCCIARSGRADDDIVIVGDVDRGSYSRPRHAFHRKLTITMRETVNAKHENSSDVQRQRDLLCTWCHNVIDMIYQLTASSSTYQMPPDTICLAGSSLDHGGPMRRTSNAGTVAELPTVLGLATE
jgi:hypothetical protein